MIRNPHTKAVAVTVVFALFALVGFLVNGAPIASFAILYALMLVHTYYSVRCFAALTEHHDRQQNMIDTALVFSYLGLALSMKDASFWIWWIVLFLLAAVKYATMIGRVAHPRLLRRKLLADLGGAAFGVLFVFFTYFFETLLHTNVTSLAVSKALGMTYFEWLTVLIFGGMTAYYLFAKPLYVHDDSV